MSSPRRSQPSIYRLTVEGQSVSFRRGERVRIGRHPQNELVLEDTSVSRFHARVEWSRRPGAPMIVDLGSSNGTYVDGVRRVRAPLSELSKIVVGDVRVSLLLVDPALTGATRARLLDERWPDSSGYLRAAEGVHALLFELERSRRTASFQLEGDGFEAQVTFTRGQIVEARAGGARGLDALNLLLVRPSGGRYSVTKLAEPLGPTRDAMPALHDLLARVTSQAS